MFESLDPIVATLAVVLGLSLVVQATQQIFKQWLDLKSKYMKFQLLAMFDSSFVNQPGGIVGFRTVASLSKQADVLAKSVVGGIEAVMQSYGYRDLELLEQINGARMKAILHGINWQVLPGGEDIRANLSDLDDVVDRWFDLAKKAYQDLYERRMKVWSFFLSALLVVVLNANIFDIYRQFSSNTPLRNAAISWAEKTVALPLDTSMARGGRSDSAIVDIKAKVDSVRAILDADGFQILGWRHGVFVTTEKEGWLFSWIMVVVGWAAMALLVSLGAPFWYDVLKSIMGLKSWAKSDSMQPQAGNLPRTGASANVADLPDAPLPG